MFTSVRMQRLLLATVAIIATQSAINAQYLSNVNATVSSFEGGVGGTSVQVTNDDGLTLVSPGVFAMTNNRFAGTFGSMWVSGFGYSGGFVDRNAAIEFDLGSIQTVDSFHVWNYNEPPPFNVRGLKDVTVQYSDDALVWKSVPKRFLFAKAPGTEGYLGENITLPFPITAKYIRFIADSNYGGLTAQSGLSKVRFHAGGTPTAPPSDGPVFPSDSGIINVKQAPYNAVGDGIADDTDALQNAIDDWQGTGQTIYLPAGTYLLSRSLKFKRGYDDNGNVTGLFGYSNFRGEGEGCVVLRLQDNTFTNPAQPQAVLDAGYNGTLPDANGNRFIRADWFNNNFGHFSVDIGNGNTGAIGVRFYSNNVGAIRNVTVTSNDWSGVTGVDFGYADQNGPFLASKISVEGFQTGIDCGGFVNSLVIEGVSLFDQGMVGIKNTGQCVSIRNLVSVSNAPAIDNTIGHVTLIDSYISPYEEDLSFPAPFPGIINNETLFARNVLMPGFGTTIRNDFGGTPNATSASISEFVSHPVVQLFGNRPTSLNLPISETPDAPVDPAGDWVNIRDYRRTLDVGDADAVQRAIDTGATTIYFPSQQTSYFFDKPVEIRGTTRRIVGMQSTFVKAVAGAGFVVKPTAPATVWLEDFGLGGGSIEIKNESSRTLVCRNLQDPKFTLSGTGSLFLENVACSPLSVSGQNVWARQLNIEGTETKIINSGGTISILGLKSEDGGTLIETKNGGKTDLLGGLYYSQRGSLNNAFMFLTENASISASIAEVNFTNPFDPFINVIQETRGTTSRTLTYPNGPTGKGAVGNALPLYVGYDDPSYLTPPYKVQAVGSTSKITLTWDAMPRATSYTVRRATSSGGSYTTVASNVTTTSYDDTTVTPLTRYYYEVQAVYPAGTSGGSAVVNAVAGQQYRINAGGSAADAFLADTYFDIGNTAFNGGNFDVTGVTNPAPQSVYQSERWNNAFTYTIPALVPGASYKVRLHFAEFAVFSPGQRVFNVAINGQPKLTNYDIVAKVGAFKAVVEEFTATADTSGNITIAFTAVVANPKLSGIEILIP